MRGDDTQPAALFSYVHLEDRIPADHPLRVIRTLIDSMLVALSPRFDALYATHGRPSIAPVDGTLLDAWASHKSFRPKDEPPPPDGLGRNPSRDFRGEQRSNATHASTTDPDARLARKSNPGAAPLSYQASVLMDNRHGLVLATDVRSPSYHAEGEAAIELLATLPPRQRRRTLGADKGYDQSAIVTALRALNVTPHSAPNLHATKPASALDTRTIRHPGYRQSQRKRKRVEQSFGWSKTVGLLRQLRHRGRERVAWIVCFTHTVYNLVRLRTLIGPTVCA
jgi:hypothetical protein